MKKLPKRLALATQTLRPLDPTQLGKVLGAGTTFPPSMLTDCASIHVSWCSCKV